jgi:hypothetical protein
MLVVPPAPNFTIYLTFLEAKEITGISTGYEPVKLSYK